MRDIYLLVRTDSHLEESTRRDWFETADEAWDCADWANANVTRPDGVSYDVIRITV